VSTAARRSVGRDIGRRVLIVVHDLPVPYDRRTWLEACTLAAAGFTVSVICPKSRTFSRSRETLEGIEIYRYPMPFEARGVLGYVAEFSWCFVATALLSLRLALLGRGFDAIHACNPPDIYWLLALAWRPLGKRFLYDHHDLAPEMYLAKYDRSDPDALHRVLLWLERMSFRTARTTLATNESYREVALTRGERRADSVFIVRSGPDEEWFRPGSAEPALKEGRRFLCCYLGKMCEQDGVDHLLRVAAILTVERGRDDVLFVLIGEGPAVPALRLYATELLLDSHCRFTGFLPDGEVSRYLSTADLAIDPDPKNAWSDRSTMNKVLDYMLFGCPIVAFDLKENRVSAQECARFVTPNSEREMADAIEELLADQETRSRMGSEGRERATAHLLWRYSEPSLLSAYDHLFAVERRS